MDSSYEKNKQLFELIDSWRFDHHFDMKSQNKIHEHIQNGAPYRADTPEDKQCQQTANAVLYWSTSRGEIDIFNRLLNQYQFSSDTLIEALHNLCVNAKEISERLHHYTVIYDYLCHGTDSEKKTLLQRLLNSAFYGEKNEIAQFLIEQGASFINALCFSDLINMCSRKFSEMLNFCQTYHLSHEESTIFKYNLMQKFSQSPFLLPFNQLKPLIDIALHTSFNVWGQTASQKEVTTNIVMLCSRASELSNWTIFSYGYLKLIEQGENRILIQLAKQYQQDYFNLKQQFLSQDSLEMSVLNPVLLHSELEMTLNRKNSDIKKSKV